MNTALEILKIVGRALKTDTIKSIEIVDDVFGDVTVTLTAINGDQQIGCTNDQQSIEALESIFEDD